MASKVILEKKAKQVEELAERLKGSLTGVIVAYEGISVADDTKLRKALREAGVEYNVIKNTILIRAAKKAGLDGLETILAGTTALATSKDDYSAAARIITKFKEEHRALKKFKVKAGFVEGRVIDAAEVEHLAKLPPKDTLIALVLGAFNAPIAAFARVLNAIVEKQQGGDDTAEPQAEAVPAE